MRYTNLTKAELADNFERVANDFYKFIEVNKLDKTFVDMGEASDCRWEHENLCDTPACHGGWAAIMYGIDSNPYVDESDFYERGASCLAKKLGFASTYMLEGWAKHYPEYWGNNNGANMFIYENAFNKSHDFPLIVIPDWYMGVVNNLRNCEK